MRRGRRPEMISSAMVVGVKEEVLTPTWQLSMPLQSPDLQAFPLPDAGPLPSLLNVQFVLPQTRPCQSSDTV